MLRTLINSNAKSLTKKPDPFYKDWAFLNRYSLQFLRNQNSYLP